MSSAGSPPRPSLRAFPSNPCVDRYFAAGSIEECRTRLMRCVERGDGPALLIGAPGMGKTMLLSVLAESLNERFEVVSIASTQLCTRRALLQAILFGLGMAYQDREEGELRLALVERLQSPAACPNGVLLLIDEAQALPVRLLEELRILTNLARDGEPVVRLVLAGGPALEEQFASTELESFNQRLAARCYLSAFNYTDTVQYIRAHVAAAGADVVMDGADELFDQAALDSVYSASDGVPRLINQVCDRAIVMAVEKAKTTIDQAMVQAAWSDLHQLAAPWHTPEVAIPAPESSVVEFGVLAGSDDEAEAADLITGAPSGSFGDWNADAALSTIADAVDSELNQPAPDHNPAVETPEPTPAAPRKTPDAGALFGEGFEEEVVIDRFAPLESAFTPTTPQVTNREDDGFGPAVEQHAYQPLPETTLSEVALPEIGEAEQPAPVEAEVAEEIGTGTTAAEAAAVLPMTPQEAEAPVDEEEFADVLVIETEAASIDVDRPGAQRQEYRQLFANLRRS